MKLTAFFHKNHRPQRIAKAPAWTDLVFREGTFLKRKRFTAPRAGVLFCKLYLPLKVGLVNGYPAVIRVRLVREPFRGKPMDPTGYDERALIPTSDGYARLSFGVPPLTPAEKGRRYRWQAQMLGHGTAETTGTHYAEWLVQ